MAKDNIGLLNDISASLKKMNQANIRQNLEAKEYQQQQLALAAGAMPGEQEVQFIPAAEDLKRRLKAQLISAKVGEKFTESGERAKRSNKEAQQNKKFKQLTSIKMKDKKVGLSTLAESIEKTNTILDHGDPDSLKLFKLIKVNTDNVVHMLGGIRTHLGMSNKGIEKHRKRQIKDAADVKRTAIEDKREKDKDKVQKMNLGGLFKNLKMPSMPSMPSGGLMKTLLLGLIAGATMAIKSWVDGFKAGGLKGAIKDLFFGNNEGGLGNAIAGAFKVGTSFALAGLLIGGPVGALVGGLIGMAVGAFTGYFGTEGISTLLFDTGKFVHDSMGKVIDKFKVWGTALGKWLYTPGGTGGPPGTEQRAKLFGGAISWDITTTIGQKITSAWRDAKDTLAEFFTGWALKIYDPVGNKVFGGVFTMPDWMDTVETAVAKVWDAVRNLQQAIKNAVIRLLPNEFTSWMGWTDADGNIIYDKADMTPASQFDGVTSDDIIPGQNIAWSMYGNYADAAYERLNNAEKAIVDRDRELKGLFKDQSFLSDNMDLTYSDSFSETTRLGSKIRTPKNNEFHTHNKGADAIIVQNIYTADMERALNPLLAIHNHYDNNLAHNLSKGNTAYQQWQ